MFTCALMTLSLVLVTCTSAQYMFDTCKMIGCSQTCDREGKGKHTCTCNPGYNLTKDGRTCDPITKCTAPVDVLFVFEYTLFMDWDPYKTIMGFLPGLSEYLSFVEDNTLVGTVLFSEEVVELTGLDHEFNFDPANQKRVKVPYLDDGTNINLALKEIVDKAMFSKKNRGREKATDVVVVFIEDKNFSKLSKDATDNLAKNNIRVVAVVISDTNSKPDLGVMTTKNVDVISVKKSESLHDIEQKLTKGICQPSG